MGWYYIIILLIVSLLLCAIGFKKYVYFMSIGYGLAVAGIGVTLFVLGLMNLPAGMILGAIPFFVLCVLLVVYGFRLSGFLLIRELKNAGYQKTLKTEIDADKKIPIFVSLAIWISVAILYVAETAGVYFRFYNGVLGGSRLNTPCMWVGIVICIFAIILESASDKQKSAQKAKRPDMVATEGLYKIVRCPNYLGEILFWTGIVVSSLDTITGFGQWLTVILGYICIVYVMFNGAQRLEKRQMKRYGDNAEYKEYANKTPIIIPLVPLYHLNKEAKED